MPPLPVFELPLPLKGPPEGYGWDDRDMSVVSSTTAFGAGLHGRDRFLGEIRCVVCGVRNFKHSHVILQSERDVWTDLRRRHWVPKHSKRDPAHESRNGLILCCNHHDDFARYQFFIRYYPVERVFVLINHSGRHCLSQFHGKAIAIDIDDQHAPFPSLFIVHEMRVRGHNPFRPIQTDVPDKIEWQDWIISGDLFPDPNPAIGKQVFKRDRPSDDDDENGSGGGGGSGNAGTDANNGGSSQRDFKRRRRDPARKPRQQGTTAGTSSGTRKLELNEDVIADILAATRAMPSWKACQMENTSWNGTADENIQRYVSSIGVEESLNFNAAERQGEPETP